MLLLPLVACIREQPLGPDPGPCADIPAGSYTWGEIPIGTCLAGPVAFELAEIDGREWAVVANSDPYRSFSSGSVLLFDPSRIDLSVGFNLISDLDAHAIALDPFVGNVVVVPGRDLALAPNRFSEGSLTTDAPDHLDVIDLSTPSAPVPWADGPEVAVGADPQPVVVDASTGLAYVLNLTDHTVQVLDVDGSPIRSIPIAPDASITAGDLTESATAADEAINPPLGSQAELVGAAVVDTDYIITDQWSMTWVDGTYRVWRPLDDGGIERLATGGDDVYAPSGLGEELDPEVLGITSITDPFPAVASGSLAMFAAAEGVILETPWNPDVSAWAWPSTVVLLEPRAGEFDAWIGSPSTAIVDSQQLLFYEARKSEADPPTVAVAVSNDGVNFEAPDAPLVPIPDGYAGVGQPFVFVDERTFSVRLYVSLWDGAHWSLGLSESQDHGATFPAPIEILTEPGGDLAAPAVTWAGGRYLLWATAGDGTAWRHVAAWSWDGIHWSTPRDVLESDVAYDPLHPPRLGIQADPVSAWRVTGDDAGWIDALAASGPEIYAPTRTGFALSVTSGERFGNAEIGVDGIEPGGFAKLPAGESALYVTLWDGATPRLAAVTPSGEMLADDLVPHGQGGNDVGALSPAIIATGSGYTLFYGAIESDGAIRMHRATSHDGLAFDAESTALFDSGDAWDGVAQLPHSVEDLGGGQLRVWYGGSNGSRFRIGSAIGTTTFAAEPGGELPWQINSGDPGAFDDSGVRDPYVLTEDGTTHLWYSGFDGTTWRIGHLSRPAAGGDWVARTDLVTGEVRPALSGADHSFAAGGAYSPVLVATADGWSGFYAGSLFELETGLSPRVGALTAEPAGDVLFSTDRFPTAGDVLAFSTHRGDDGSSTIPLAQFVDGINASGTGSSAMVLDADRGLLFVTSKLSPVITVIDIRDDSSPTFDDANAFDIEAMVVASTVGGPRGYRDIVLVPGTDTAWLPAQNPDLLVKIDLSSLVDDDRKETITDVVIDILPLLDASEDDGPDTITSFPTTSGPLGGADVALSSDGRWLWVPEFRANRVAVFDLDLGPSGQQIASIPYVGEGPWQVRFSTDETLAYVLNYTGTLRDDGAPGATIAVIDADPDSTTFLQPLTWIGNRKSQ